MSLTDTTIRTAKATAKTPASFLMSGDSSCWLPLPGVSGGDSATGSTARKSCYPLASIPTWAKRCPRSPRRCPQAAGRWH